MQTLLLKWNPRAWTWSDLSKAASQTKSGTPYETRWSLGSRKEVSPGDRVFLIRLVEEPRGVIASGQITSESFFDKHWDSRFPEKQAVYAYVSFDRILDPEEQLPLPLSELNSAYLNMPASKTQAGGISIDSDDALALENLWINYLDTFENGSVQWTEKRRNPVWKRDELILALDLYIRHGGKWLNPANPEVLELSRLLNTLPIHQGVETNQLFRNPNGVVMKMMNFRRFDPAQSGTGMKRGNTLEKEVWDQFAASPSVLRQVAMAISEGAKLIGIEPNEDPAEAEFFEGRILYRLHRMKERDAKLIATAKAIEKKKNGRLACKVCDFDFAKVYGPLGEDFIEGHHTKPISELLGVTKMNVADIALVCANCHRMLHRGKKPLSIEELATKVSERNGDTGTPASRD